MSDRVYDLASAICCAWALSRPDGISQWDDPLPYDLEYQLAWAVRARSAFAPMRERFFIVDGRVVLFEVLAMAHSATFTEWRGDVRCVVLSPRLAHKIAKRDGFSPDILRRWGEALRAPLPC